MGMKGFLCALMCLPTFAQADTYVCAGGDPDWLLTVNETDGKFDFNDRILGLNVMLLTPAEGRDWPKALTLISSVDSAIVILNQQQCGSDDYSAQVLTQRNTTAILLTGCCNRRMN